MVPGSVWEIVFLMVILKIPIVYLCTVIYYAVKAEPRRGRGGSAAVRVEPDSPSSGSGRFGRRPRRRPPRPHGGPVRVYARSARVALARADRIADR